MPNSILCVAEKPSIAKAVAHHLAGGPNSVRVANTSNQFIKNYIFDFAFNNAWGNCSVTMTSVIGHINNMDFELRYRKWQSCQPGDLFDAPVEITVDKDKLGIARNIKEQARYARALFIWTDCDREGEHIGSEVRDIAFGGNPRLEVKRARFSNIERAHVLAAAHNPINLDERQANAVAARIELDLRIGASFTRLQTLNLQTMGGSLSEKIISYGSCQFPTLGFVVDRYFRVKNFIPEQFWGIKLIHQREDIMVNFLWSRGHLFDRMSVILLYERCLNAGQARVTKMQKKPTSKWRPLPLTTVELQKMGSRFLSMDSQRVMKVAEELYTKGFISYPRTETDQFDKAIDLKKLIEKQVGDVHWGQYSQELLNGSFVQPRPGHNNDQAHPPIHPVAYVAGDTLPSLEHRRVYEFVVRRFLACCSADAKGERTTVEIEFGEDFHTSGLVVLERNYLAVYPYDKWESSQQLPNYTLGEQFVPSEATMTDGKTSAPGYLTEPELISLMDANGIGTDATMAEHIAKIKEREYVFTKSRGGGDARAPNDTAQDDEDGRGRGRGRGAPRGRAGRGRGRGRGNAAGAGGSGVQEFIPTPLGIALVEGYDNVGHETSLSKPFLRKEMEVNMKQICDGIKTRNDVVQESLAQYRQVYIRTAEHMDILKAACRKYVLAN
ncbi:MAG: DNA topoisomerase [Trizodia sp. TS-e1964]|nr:MAG: DNA topoisomerase [Trizodia sp. TS-e1964]